MASRARQGGSGRRRPPQRGTARRDALLVSGLAALLLGWWIAARHAVRPPPLPDSRAALMARARAINAAIPFADAHPAAARPFRFHGTPAAREQAAQCLATAALYEAGRDPAGQSAVMQVVLNRVGRAPFPDTVCGVVYQGAARVTGCQFSFTCDGSRMRRPEHAGWEEARRRARRALAGRVYAPVGTATHYHTDWIVPYWSGSLDKIARINGHLFYRPRPAHPAHRDEG